MAAKIFLKYRKKLLTKDIQLVIVYRIKGVSCENYILCSYFYSLNWGIGLLWWSYGIGQ
jgi:hypothetical protein